MFLAFFSVQPRVSDAPRLQTEKSFFILEMEIVQLCSSSVLPHEISAQNCAGFEAKQKSKSSWTHSNPGTWKRCRFLKWKTDWLPLDHGSGKVWTKIWQVLYCVTWNTFLRFLIPERKTLAKTCRRGASCPTLCNLEFLNSTLKVAYVAESSKIGESGGAFQTEKTAIISFSRVFLRKFCTKTELTQSFCTILRRSRIERARFSWRVCSNRTTFRKVASENSTWLRKPQRR